MARQPDIHYVQIYNPGSTARKLELMPRPKKKKVPLPKPKVQKQRQRILHVDPLAICATAAAGLLLVAMVVGMLRLGTSAGEARALQATVTALQQENEALRQSMEQNYDPEEVAQKGYFCLHFSQQKIYGITIVLFILVNLVLGMASQPIISLIAEGLHHFA